VAFSDGRFSLKLCTLVEEYGIFEAMISSFSEGTICAEFEFRSLESLLAKFKVRTTHVMA
jgi:hypothetical protein